MWRGPVVQARKEAVNNAKGKVFGLHAKLISLAAMKWGNPDDNPSLAAAMYEARKAGVPNDNITRAIKKWTGEDTSGEQIQEITYEWYAAGWVALLVHCVTDNKNRTVANIRHIFSKCGWNMWESGSVSWMFEKKWVFFIDAAHHSFDDVEVLALETEVEDVLEEAGYIKVITAPESFEEVKVFLEKNNIEIYESKRDDITTTEVELTEQEKVLKFTTMLQSFDEDEDVHSVSSNEIIDPKLQKEVDIFIAEHSFRT